MMRRILIAISVSVLAFTLIAEAADPPKAAKSDDRTPRSIQEEARLKQEIVQGQFREFELKMLQVANRLLASGKQEDREKGQVLMEAIKLANAEGVDVRFQKLVEMLKTSKAASLQDVKEAIDQAELLTQNLRAILNLLVNDTREAQLKAEKERIQNLLKELNKIIRDQKIVKVNTERGTDPDRTAGDQDRVARATNDLAQQMGGKGIESPKGESRGEGRKGNNKGEAKEDTRGPKGESHNGEGKNTDGKNSDGKEGKTGDGKEGKEGKPGDGKEGKAGEGKEGKGGEGKPGEGKSGEGKEGKGGEGKGGDPKAGEGKEGKGGDGKGGQGKEGKAGEGKGGDGKEGKGGEGKEGKGGDGKGGEGKAGEGKEGKGGDGKGGDGKGGEGKSGEGKGGDPKAGEGKGGGKSGEGKGGDPKAGGDGKGGEGKGGEGKGGDPKAGGDGKGGEGKGGDPKAGGDGKGGPGKGGEGKGQAQGKGQGKGGDGKGAGKAAGEAKGAGKGGDGKGGDGKGGDGKGGDGKGGDGKGGDGKGGEGKGGQQGQARGAGQQPQGGQQGGQKGGQQGPPPVAGNKQVEDALPFQKQAKNDIQNKETAKAPDQQQKAIDKLDEARKRLEEILKQLREEEIERLLAQLQARCEYMLQLQKAIYEGTVRLDKTIGENPGKKPTRPDEITSGKLADQEGLVLQEATRAREMIVSEGSAVAFAEVFTQLIDDIKLAQKNLNKTDVGLFTQKVERDIIDTLIEMIEALKKAQQEMKQQQGQPQQGNPPPPGQQQQKLIDLLAELKMIRSMQIRVNKRTEDYGKLFPGEQADVPDIQKELHSLADRQDKIKKIVHDIATGKNQ